MILGILAIIALAVVLWLTQRRPRAGRGGGLVRHARTLHVHRTQLKQHAEELAIQRDALELERERFEAERERVGGELAEQRQALARSHEAMELHAAAVTRHAEAARRQGAVQAVLLALADLDRLRTGIVVTTGEDAAIPIRHATWRRAVESYWHALPARSRLLRQDEPELDDAAELGRLREDARAVHDGGREQIDRFVRQLDVVLRLCEQSPMPEEALRLVGAQVSAGELSFLMTLGQIGRLPEGLDERLESLGARAEIRCRSEWQKAFVRANGRLG